MPGFVPAPVPHPQQVPQKKSNGMICLAWEPGNCSSQGRRKGSESPVRAGSLVFTKEQADMTTKQFEGSLRKRQVHLQEPQGIEPVIEK